MANITITANVTVDIHLENVSMESYQKLVDYINGMGGGKAESKAESKPEAQTAPAVNEAKKKDNGYRRSGATDAILAKLNEAHEHPDDYVWTLCKASDWKRYVPEIAGIADRQAGYFLGRLRREGVIDGEDRYYDAKAQQYYKRFRLPVPSMKEQPKPSETVKAEAEQPVTTSKAQQLAAALNYRDQEAGEILRSARKGAGMTLRDMSEAIGYDVPIINAWEVGKYHMADLQKKVICDYFHRDIFAEAAKA